MAHKYLKVNLKSVVKIVPCSDHIKIHHISGFVRYVWFDTQIIYMRDFKVKNKKKKVLPIDINYEPLDLFSFDNKIRLPS